jgi:hypothetical protein
MAKINIRFKFFVAVCIETAHMLHISYSMQADNGSIHDGGTGMLTVSVGLHDSEYGTVRLE